MGELQGVAVRADLPGEQRRPERLYDFFRQAWTELRAEEEYAGLFESTEEERRWGVESMQLLANYFSVEDPAAVEPATANEP